jgi:CRISPR-associated endonuclease/helicase Cas3
MNRFVLTDDEAAEPEVARRLNAPKTLYLRDGELQDIVSLALSYSDARRRVLVYVRHPKNAEVIARAIAQQVGHERVAILTGTIRGHERDEMTTRPLEDIHDPWAQRQAKVFRDFRLNPDRPPPDYSEYLVATSAGEVGVDLDADDIVCDLTHLDSMIQRFGRVNRLGRTESTIQAVQLPARRADDVDDRLIATREALLSLPRTGHDGHNASPLALQALNERHDAFSKPPRTLPLTDVLLDNWTLTCVPQISPAVDRYLHGLVPEPPDMYVAWREEVGFLLDATAETITDWLDTHPVLSREQVRGSLPNVVMEIRKIARREERAILIPQIEEEVRVIDLAEFDEDENVLRGLYRNALLLLPPSAGGLNRQGMLDGDVEDAVTDVADEPTPPDYEHRRFRVLVEKDGDEWVFQTLATSSEGDSFLSFLAPNLYRALQQIRRQFPGAYVKDTVVLETDGQGSPARAVMSFVHRQSAETVLDTSAAPVSQELDEHLRWAAEEAESIARRLSLPPEITSALVIAAQVHDLGKNREAWQRAIGHPPGGDGWKPWAKSARRSYDRSLVGSYRHEFGSLRQAMHDPEIIKHPERDLILHLVACHHGWARPHYEPGHWDIADDVIDEENQEIANETMRRMARVQRTYGHWGLAWLESLMRCSDYAASRRLDQENPK